MIGVSIQWNRFPVKEKEKGNTFPFWQDMVRYNGSAKQEE
jgi:hypothetical protein